MNIALIAHDHKKDDMVMVATEFAAFLSRCHLLATGTTGGRLQLEIGLEVERCLSGPMGGDLQIGARLAVGEVDAVIFLRDPMTPQPHEPDIDPAGDDGLDLAGRHHAVDDNLHVGMRLPIARDALQDEGIVAARDQADRDLAGFAQLGALGRPLGFLDLL